MSNYMNRVWASMHEPRALTVVAVLAYAVTALAGLVVLVLVLTVPGDQARDIALGAFSVVAVLSGVIGAPSAWTGRHYREGVAALGVVMAGVLVITDAALVATDPDPLRPRIAVLAAWGGLQAVAWGLNRYVFLRHSGPYAVGHGPQLAEHRIEAATAAMELQEVEAQRRTAAATARED